MHSSFATLASILLFVFYSQCEPIRYQTEVLILGAGVAGITAAKTLHDSGIEDFIIVEATNKIGGRVRNTEFGGYRVELGANWIHGRLQDNVSNPIYNFAELYGLQGVLDGDDSVLYGPDGSLLTDLSRFDDYEIAQALAVDLSIIRRSRGQADLRFSAALGLSGWTPRNPEEDFIDWLYHDNCFAEAARITSTLYSYPAATYMDFGHDMYFIIDQRGYVYFLERIAAEFLDYPGDPRLHFNSLVTDIIYNDTSVTVITSNGTIYEAKYAIITFSLGVLQKGTVRYVPKLPVWKKEAILKFDMALYQKIFVKFPEAFWDNVTSIFYVDEVKGWYPYAKNLNYNIDGSNILVFFLTDEFGFRAATIDTEQVKQDIMVILRKIYGEEIPEPLDILLPDWWTNPLFYGAYSNWPIDVSLQTFKNMISPYKTLHFSGEHTSQKYYGYVHGAYDSGVREGNIVAARVLSLPTCVLARTGFLVVSNTVSSKKRIEIQITTIEGFPKSSFRNPQADAVVRIELFNPNADVLFSFSIPSGPGWAETETSYEFSPQTNCRNGQSLKNKLTYFFIDFSNPDYAQLQFISESSSLQLDSIFGSNFPINARIYTSAYGCITAEYYQGTYTDSSLVSVL